LYPGARDVRGRATQEFIPGEIGLNLKFILGKIGLNLNKSNRTENFSMFEKKDLKNYFLNDHNYKKLPIKANLQFIDGKCLMF